MGFEIKCSHCRNKDKQEILTDASTLTYNDEGTITIFISFRCQVCGATEEIGRIEQPRVMFFLPGM